mmetsp:Transcript_20496/g.44483  ORF Transcript_20496/g.44483 Transcript_20496/m.44483 type:complete len:546 (+) Transcript_20496:89-1726(+)
MAPSPQLHAPITWKLAFIAALAACLPSPSSSSSSPSSLASPARWIFPNVKLANRCRENLFFGSTNGSIRSGNCDKSYVLDESDFEDNDYFNGSDNDESNISRATNSFRGGAAVGGRAGATPSRINLPGLPSGWLKKNGQNGKPRGKRRPQQRQQQQMQQLQNLQQEKMRQFRKLFRQKQRQFQTSLYYLNSRLNYEFPKPPYSLWQMDSEPAFGKTTLTGKIFFLNIAVFGLQTMYPQLTALGAKRSDMIMEGRQLYRLLTPVFLHGGIGHLVANSYSLKSMGGNVERAFGQPRLIATYLVSGVMGNVLSAIQSPNPAVGASGAIFGLVGAYYTFLSRNQEVFGRSAHMQKGALIETIGINLALGMINPMIDNWGHIGGFIGGVGMAYLIGPKLYVARVPLGDDNLSAGGFGAGKVVVDRPMFTFRTPDIVDEGIFWVNDNARKLGRRATASISGLFNSGSQEYFLDRNVDYSMGSNTSNGDGTIYRTLKDGIQVEGNVNVTPSDGFRQDVSELDPMMRQRERRQRRRAPKAGSSLRPKYGHLYR